jgi:hypothetical protein
MEPAYTPDMTLTTLYFAMPLTGLLLIIAVDVITYICEGRK